MKRQAKIFIIYFPVILIAGQVLANMLYFVRPDWYNATGFYLNTFFGTNVLFAIFLMVFTFTWNFCAVSRYAAIGQMLFALNYLIVKEDGLYNILFQVIVGTLAILLTFRHYIKRFPLCRISMVISFIEKVISHGSCKKGLECWEKDLKRLVANKYESTRHKH